MPIGEVVLLIGAINGSVGALGLIATPIMVAVINRKAAKAEPEPDPVEQGQSVKPDAAVKRERNAYRRALNRANDRLAEAGLPLEHPDL